MLQARDDSETTARREALQHMLCGYRFRVCLTATDVDRALAVRRRVYREELGITLPIPDAYDGRSVLLLAENTTTGEAIGTIRVLPRSGGPLELEEHFELPLQYRTLDAVEIGRFAVLRDYRGTPVMAGLLKLMLLCIQQMEARWLMAGSPPSRTHTYAWLHMKSTGLTAHYDGVGEEITLMACDFPEVARTAGDHPLYDFMLEIDSPEVELDDRVSAMLRNWKGVKLAS